MGTHGDPVENFNNKAFSSSLSRDTISQNHVMIWSLDVNPWYCQKRMENWEMEFYLIKRELSQKIVGWQYSDVIKYSTDLTNFVFTIFLSGVGLGGSWLNAHPPGTHLIL